MTLYGNRFRNLLPLVALLVGVAILGAPTRAHAGFIELDFSSLAGGGVTFNPADVSPPANGVGSFSFNQVTSLSVPGVGKFSIPPSAFSITNSTGVGDAVNLLGNITGSYNVGPITTSGNTQQAMVVNDGGLTHQFTITDASGSVFSADVGWIAIRTTGVGGLINADGQVNLTNITYSGTNADLQQLYNESQPNQGVATISFQLASSASLTQLFSGASSTTTSFSGSVAPAPAPAPPGLLLLGVGGVTIGVGRLFRRRKAFLKAI